MEIIDDSIFNMIYKELIKRNPSQDINKDFEKKYKTYMKGEMIKKNMIIKDDVKDKYEHMTQKDFDMWMKVCLIMSYEDWRSVPLEVTDIMRTWALGDLIERGIIVTSSIS
jgi:hypothetical protein